MTNVCSVVDRRICNSSLEVIAVGMMRTTGYGKQGGHCQYRATYVYWASGIERMCMRDSLKDDKKVDTYRNKENIYGNCST